MSDPGIEWRVVYGDRQTVFVRGIARGDYYAAPRGQQEVYRMRFWPRFRLQGGQELLVMGEDRARATLLRLAREAYAAEADEE